MDAQQELFIKLKTRLEQQGYDVYDGTLPPEGTPYPFIYLGNTQQSDQMLKAGIIGSVSQMIHIYHNNVRQRGSVSGICTVVKAVCRSIMKTENFSWHCTNIDQQILPDNTTREPLMHGIITADFIY